ncbi:MAG: helix-turn-helix transcriptional regulator [Pseudonocardia sp.]
MADDGLIDTLDLADFLGVHESTLRVMRREGTGPPFVRLGRGPRGVIRYRWGDVLTWVDAHTEVVL